MDPSIPYNLKKYIKKLKLEEQKSIKSSNDNINDNSKLCKKLIKTPQQKSKLKQTYIENIQGKKLIDNLRKMVAKNQLLFYHPSVQQALEDYIIDNTDEEKLEDYMNKLVKYKLIKMNYEPNKILLECKHFENKFNQLKKLHDNNPNIKHLTINECNINIANIQLISKFTNLRELNLQSVDLDSGSGFFIKKLNNLETLDIENNPRLNFQDYEDITSMKSITDLDISLNTNINSSRYNGEIFKLIGNMTQLEVLNMELTVPGIDKVNEQYYATAIKDLKRLEVLIYSQCKLTGSCLHSLEKRSLSKLYLDNNEINDEGITIISKINSLTVLNLSQNGFGVNSINIKPLFNMKNLKELDLSFNSLEQRHIVGIDKLTNTIINLDNNLIII